MSVAVAVQTISRLFWRTCTATSGTQTSALWPPDPSWRPRMLMWTTSTRWLPAFSLARCACPFELIIGPSAFAELCPLIISCFCAKQACYAIAPQESEYRSADSAHDTDNPDMFPNEFLNTLCPSGLPPHLLKLKVGMPIMLLRNMNAARGLANGTRLILRACNRHYLDCEACWRCACWPEGAHPPHEHAAV